MTQTTLFLTVAQAASTTGIPAYKIRRMLANGTLLGVQPGKPSSNPSRAYKWYVRRDSLEDLASSPTPPNTGE